MINKELIHLVYAASAMQRWNDHIRPHCGFTELDKQAHKMIYAYLLARVEEHDRAAIIDWPHLIELSICGFLQRVVLTDLKPPIFHRLMEGKRSAIGQWVQNALQPATDGLAGGFSERLEKFLAGPPENSLEMRILQAAHYLATSWEFKIIQRFNEGLYGLDATKRELEGEMEEHIDLAGVQKLRMGQKSSAFLDLTGQLRFQRRWAHTPRIPETSVLGHMLVVAMLSYLVSMELAACPRRLYNNYFGGLFHDLPEALTRDIISPVKESVEGLESLIKDIEIQMMRERVLPLLPSFCRPEISFFVENEFASRICNGGQVQDCPSSDIQSQYNEDRYDPIDGEIIKACDKLAAYIEAALSVSYGIKPRSLEEAIESIYAKNSGATIAGYSFQVIYDSFR